MSRLLRCSTFVALAGCLTGSDELCADPESCDPQACAEATGDEDGCLAEQPDLPAEAALSAQPLRTPGSVRVFSSVDPGAGTVTATSSAPDALCALGSCDAPAGASVTLSAEASSYYRFLRWTGCSKSTSPIITLSPVRPSTHCRAHFSLPVLASVVGGYRNPGNVTVSTSDSVCTASTFSSCYVPYGSTVTLTANVPEGFRFVGWSGCVASHDDLTLVLEDVTTLTQCIAQTVIVPIEVTWSVVGGGGEVSGFPAGVDVFCSPTSCQARRYSGVRLEALPDPGYRFAGWSGCSDSLDSQLLIFDITDPLHCEAHFEPL